jgi:hypothetical protein
MLFSGKGHAMGHGTFRKTNSVRLEVEQLEARLVLSVPPKAAVVASAIVHSDESYAFIVTDIYNAYLGRTPDPKEVAPWVANMKGGMTEEQVAAFILGSQEYLNLNGGGRDFINALYDDVLNRNPTGDPNLEAEFTDPVGFNGWYRIYSAPGASRTAIAYAFVTSPESESLTITTFYQDYLGRNPSSNEINQWVAVFNGGTSNVDIRAMFVSSAEYYANALNNNTDWITHLYADLLGRPDNSVTPPVPAPAPSEIASWVNFMS